MRVLGFVCVVDVDECDLYCVYVSVSWWCRLKLLRGLTSGR